MDQRPARRRRCGATWEERLEAYRAAHPELAAEFERVLAGRLPDGWERGLPDLSGVKPQATRESSSACIQGIASSRCPSSSAARPTSLPPRTR